MTSSFWSHLLSVVNQRVLYHSSSLYATSPSNRPFPLKISTAPIFPRDSIPSFYFSQFPKFAGTTNTRHPIFKGVFGSILKLSPSIKIMGSEPKVEDLHQLSRKPRFLCLHGFRTSGEILKKQVDKWPPSVRQKLDLVFADGPWPAQGKSDVEGIFDPPYYEWFQFNKEFTTYTNFEECLEYIQDLMMKHGPIDGFLGFSQGAILSAALPGLQAQGLALTKVPKIKFLVIIGGAQLKAEEWAQKAYASPIECPSIHFLGKEDFLRPYGEELLKSVVDPFVICHPKGHTVPRIDEKSLPTMLSFIDKIQKIISEDEKDKENNEQLQYDTALA